jgi:hypothetical protein
MAKSTFRANYGVALRRNVATPDPDVNFDTTAGGNVRVNVSVATTVNTFFIRVLPQWHTMRIADDAQAVRANAIITLVLDRSGSMDPGCNLSSADCSRGGLYLPSAVRNFIQRFDNNLDQVALESFASTATNNVVMGRSFKNAVIQNSTLTWCGGTFAYGGLTNGFAINSGVTVPNGQTALKVVVFFTDGMANMIQDRLSCPDGTSKPWVFGGYSSGSEVAFFATNSPITCAQQACPDYTLSGGQPSGCPNVPARCSGSTFPSILGGTKTITQANVVMEATNRCIAVANQMRASGMIVYAIGLDVTGLGTPQKNFLNDLANDPSSSKFNRNLPAGIAFTLGNGSDLQGAFQQVAADILLRLIE